MVYMNNVLYGLYINKVLVFCTNTTMVLNISKYQNDLYDDTDNGFININILIKAL